jgi:hypothetical protein
VAANEISDFYFFYFSLLNSSHMKVAAIKPLLAATIRVAAIWAE